MAKTLKSTGQATELLACIGVDDDGTVTEFVNGWTDADTEMTVHANVTTATGSWKSASLDYFSTTGSGATPEGVSFAAAAIEVNIGSGSSGIGVFAAFHDLDTGSSFTKHAITFEGTSSLKPSGSPQKWILNFGADFNPSTTTVSSGSKQSVGYNYVYNSDDPYYYGLESGSLAQDGTQGNDGGRGSDGDDFTGVGGISGQGWVAVSPYIVCLFSSPRTLTQMQALHDDWNGELFEAAASGAGPLESPMKRRTLQTLLRR